MRWYQRLGLSGLLTLALVVGYVAPSAAQGIVRDEGTAIYLPRIMGTGQESVQPALAGSEPVYGLLGRLEPAPGRRYSTFLITPEATYGVVGITPDVERELVALSRRTPPVAVKVWGTLYPSVNLSRRATIVVTGVLEAGVATGVVGASVPVAVVRFELVNLYAGPGSTYPRVGQVKLNQACDVTGRNQTGTWLQLTCADNLQGWIDARLVQVDEGLNGVPVVEATGPEATPVPSTGNQGQPSTGGAGQTGFQGWQASFYDNPRLDGTPVVVLDLPTVQFDWGTGSPNPAVPADNFSAVFERRIQFAPGYYRFTVDADDGVRVYLDGQLLVDEWHGTTGRVYAVGRTLSGDHLLRIEYYEGYGLAHLRFDTTFLTSTPEWTASYYEGIDLAGPPVLVQQEPRSSNPLDFNWGYQSPVAGVLREDSWSARWTGTFRFEAGDYIFRANADDGVRVYLDGLLVIDQWRDGYKEVSNRFVGVGAGEHTVTVEYYDRAGIGLLQVWWTRDTSSSP
ncbi:hypothetical protein FKZ61_007895 [Litorilinea aerophila]|uniref:PA14 domain-containing protein n=1 Tax=Litorilinea aerophila TaxID=1204385 RepID=A0A540VHZ9_9CHLR|nr:PA14 domain-containing protein [Litorilinea aerophila]MCC9076030.1 hypothetical protein [Litorilinea aerophila]OUC07744.1 hypothetical protein RY27_13075 [Litorilinea aerophila]